MITQLNRRLFTVEEYYRMAKTGILTAEGYALSKQKSGSESLTIQAFPDIQLKVSEILP